MGTFFSVIFIVILGFYILGAILKLVLRVWLTRKMKDFEKSGKNFGGGFYGFGQHQGGGAQHDESKREGEVKVERTDSEQRKINEKVGDYVDFEETKPLS